MKVFAVIPALLVLVSLCGSPVPPPPGTVTGSVFFDANRNGIRDSCDAPMKNTEVVVKGPEGASGTARTGDDGVFRIDDAPVGDGLVTLFAGEGGIWPITTELRRVHVESSKTVTGFEIGAASKAVYDADTLSITGIVFDDSNGNGEIDRDECPIKATAGLQVRSGDRIAVIDGRGVFELKQLPEGHTLEITAGYSEFATGVYPDPFGGRPLRPTSAIPGDQPCSARYTARPRYGAMIYEANLGFTLKSGNSAVSGVVFEDTDADGRQGDAEAAVAGAWVRVYAGGGCAIYGDQWAAASDADGKFTIGGLYPGTYEVHVDINPIGEDASSFVTLRDGPKKITVAGDDDVILDMPVKVGPPGSISVLVFDDNDGDSLRDEDESAGAGIQVCAYMAAKYVGTGVPPDYYYLGGPAYGDCTTTASDGTATLERLPEGAYEAWLSEPRSGLIEDAGRRDVQVNGGEQTSLIFPLDLTSPEEQVIHPGEGRALQANVCQADPTWVQPDFDSRWDDSIRERTGYDIATARLIYGHGIYQTQYGEMFTWALIAGFQLEFSQGCNYGSTYALVGYEPLEPLTTDTVSQVMLRRTGIGVYLIVLPDLYASDAGVHLFVDENYTPIVRCFGNYGCEWNDGTAPYLYEGHITAGR